MRMIEIPLRVLLVVLLSLLFWTGASVLAFGAAFLFNLVVVWHWPDDLVVLRLIGAGIGVIVTGVVWMAAGPDVFEAIIDAVDRLLGRS